MLRSTMHLGLLCFLAICLVTQTANCSDNAAIQYTYAVLELDRVPAFVDSATTDDPDTGFAQKLSSEQLSYLQGDSVQSALARIDNASTQERCEWQRYETDTWTDAGLNDRLHQLSRVVLLRARASYEQGKWIDGNRDVEYVRTLARRMTQQARFFERQCFMIENMATGTAAAYLLQFPKPAIVDLSERTRRIDVFSPMPSMLVAESTRLRSLARNIELENVATSNVDSCLSAYLTLESLQSFKLLGKTEKAQQVLRLSNFLQDLSEAIQAPYADAEQQIAALYAKNSQPNATVMGFSESPVEYCRENAQGICRGQMFSNVIESLLAGSADFSRIPDPYGDQYLKLLEHKFGFTLESELKNFSAIDMRFGIAPRHGA